MAGVLTLFFLIIAVTFGFGSAIDNYELKSVLVLTRHNIRTPLYNVGNFSPNPWPVWNGSAGDLTQKGFMLETYMGRYFSEWLKEEGMFSDYCPDAKDVFVYANTKQRTRETAKAFVQGAFNNCKINITVKSGTEMDPVFNPVILESAEEIKDEIIKDMTEKIDEVDLKEAFTKLEKLIDLKSSNSCKVHSVCDLRGKNEIVYRVGHEPNIHGPLEIGNSLVDALLMAYYEGFDVKEIKSIKNFEFLMKINIQNHNVRFNSTAIAKFTSKNLIDYIKGVVLDENPPKFSILVGHDSNLIPVMRAINVECYQLPDQIEVTPIGSKLVFQKWWDETTSRDLFKLDYLYPSVDQLRNGIQLSLQNPPKIVALSLRKCKKDSKGFCLWSDFVDILNHL